MKVALVDDSGSLLMMAMEANKRRLGQLKNSDNRQAYLWKNRKLKALALISCQRLRTYCIIVEHCTGDYLSM